MLLSYTVRPPVRATSANPAESEFRSASERQPIRAGKPQGARTEAQQDKIVFIFNFFDELRRIAPVKR